MENVEKLRACSDDWKIAGSHHAEILQRQARTVTVQSISSTVHPTGLTYMARRVSDLIRGMPSRWLTFSTRGESTIASTILWRRVLPRPFGVQKQGKNKVNKQINASTLNEVE